MNETKCWSLKKINKIDKHSATWTKKKREKTQITKIRNESGDTTTNSTGKKQIRNYYKKLQSKKLDNLNEMDKFLETNLNHEEIEHLNRLITRKETESVITNLPTKKSPRPNGFIGEFYQTFKGEPIPILLKLLPKIEEWGTLSNSFCEASITLMPKPDKDTTKKKTTYQCNTPH